MFVQLWYEISRGCSEVPACGFSTLGNAQWVIRKSHNFHPIQHFPSEVHWRKPRCAWYLSASGALESVCPSNVPQHTSRTPSPTSSPPWRCMVACWLSVLLRYTVLVLRNFSASRVRSLPKCCMGCSFKFSHFNFQCHCHCGLYQGGGGQWQLCCSTLPSDIAHLIPLSAWPYQKPGQTPVSYLDLHPNADLLFFAFLILFFLFWSGHRSVNTISPAGYSESDQTWQSGRSSWGLATEYVWWRSALINLIN